jgi:virulence factor Mce-like protein
MGRGRRGSLAGSPLLIGAITTLIIVVAVFLSYNANNGLPFVPTYNLKVALPEASGLQPSNQVRIAGTRVGIVTSLSARQDPATGRVTAIADLKLEKGVEPLPADTRAIVQSVSAIGLKYLELERGTSQGTLKNGATIPLSQTREPVDIDELFNMFDEKTRTANQVNLNNFGDGLAGRGVGLNGVIAELRPLVVNAVPVLRNLASAKTDLRGFFKGLDAAASAAAPVAGAQARFYSDLDTFFSAFASVAPSLERSITGGPASLEQATHSLPYEASFVEKSTEFMRLLRPSASALRTVAAPLGHAIAEGAVNLRAATGLNTRLESAAQAFQSFAQNPVVTLGLEQLTQTAELGIPVLAGIAPEQSSCNYVTLAFRNLASLQAESVGVGTLARAATVLAPIGPNSEGVPSSSPANGGGAEKEFSSGTGTAGTVDRNFLHVNPYPQVAGPGQSQICEAGNETFEAGKDVVGRLPAASVTTNREITSREENLYGEKYSPAQLKALGIATPKKKGKAK